VTIREGVQIIVDPVEAVELVTAQIEITIGVVAVDEIIEIVVDRVVTDLVRARRLAGADRRFESVTDHSIEVAGTTHVTGLGVQGLAATASVGLAAGIELYQEHWWSVGLTRTEVEAPTATLPGLP